MSKLLFCYDDRPVIDLIRRRMEGLGRSYRIVETYTEALTQAESGQYDAYFLDFQNQLDPRNVCDIADKIKELWPGSKVFGMTQCSYSPNYEEMPHFEEIVVVSEILDLKFGTNRDLDAFLIRHHL